MNDHPESHNGVVHPSVKYEPTDLSFRAVLTFSAGLVATLVVVTAGLFLMAHAFFGSPPPPEPVGAWDFKAEPSPNGGASYLPAKPELEAIDQLPTSAQETATVEGGASTRPIRDQVRAEDEHLNSYGAVKGQKETYYIPIEEAMRRLGGKPPAEAARPAEGPGVSAVSTSGRLTPGEAP